MQEKAEADVAEQAREAEDRAVAQRLSEADTRLLNWHWAHLEYGCSSRLSDVSLAHWNQVSCSLLLIPCQDKLPCRALTCRPVSAVAAHDCSQCGVPPDAPAVS